jgi:hypothetical protein
LVIIGGLLLSTGLTLIVVPAIYKVLARFTSVAPPGGGVKPHGSCRRKDDA